MDPLKQSPRRRDRRWEDSPIAEQPGRSRESANVTETRAFDIESAELLHELNNVLVSMLLNAQVMEWKLPSYSRLKRNLHEVERNAQRGGELVKRLLKRLEAESHGNFSNDKCVVQDLSSVDVAAAEQEPRLPIRDADVAIAAERRTATAFHAVRKKVPHTPV